mmetsp:Transcript_8503/g.17649  ORF Transcript_8503/g.17649 Transcript_8503/m.17649 type:complete len:238 (+) Transcript_8503:348-1061(+)
MLQHAPVIVVECHVIVVKGHHDHDHREQGTGNEFIHFACRVVGVGDNVANTNGHHPVYQTLEEGDASRQVFKLKVGSQKGQGRGFCRNGHNLIHIIESTTQQHGSSYGGDKNGHDFQGKRTQQKNASEAFQELGHTGIFGSHFQRAAANVFVNGGNHGTRHQGTGSAQIDTPIISAHHNVRHFGVDSPTQRQDCRLGGGAHFGKIRDRRPRKARRCQASPRFWHKGRAGLSRCQAQS